MESDKVLDSIVLRIQEDIKKNFKTILTEDEIYNIIDSQFRHILIAMGQKRPIKLNYFGRFIIKAGREVNWATDRELNRLGVPKERANEIRKARNTAGLLDRKLVFQNGMRINYMTAEDVQKLKDRLNKQNN